MTTLLNRLKTTILNSPGTTDGFVIGTAEVGFVTFGAAENGKTTDVLITEGDYWELRKDCTYTDVAETLSRGTLVASSTGSAINFTTAAIVSVVLLGDRVPTFVQTGVSIGDGQILQYNSIEGNWTNTSNFIADQTGNEFKYLSTDGSLTTWVTAPSPLGYVFTGPITTAPTATGTDCLAIGEAAKAGANINAIAIGNNAYINSESGNSGAGANAIAIGTNTVVDSQSGIAIGNNVDCINNASMAFGGDATGAFARSFGGTASGGYATAYGGTASANFSISLGQGCTASGIRSIAIGHGTSLAYQANRAQGANSIAIGDGAQTATTSTAGIAIGQKANATSSSTSNPIAIGQYAYANSGTSGMSISLGAGRDGSTSYGALASRAIAIGYDAIGSGTDGISIGNYSYAGVNAVAIGAGSGFNQGAQGTGNYSITLGFVAESGGNYSISIGQGSKSSSTYQVSIGASANSRIGATGTVVIGREAFAGDNINTGTEVVAIGRSASSHANYATCLGGYAQVTQTAGTHAIVLGYGAASNAAGNITIGSSNGVNSFTNTVASSTWFGYAGKTDYVGEFAYGTGTFTAGGHGQAKLSFAVMHMTTTNATVTELATATPTATLTPTNRIVLVNDSTYLFDVDIVARNTATDTESKVWNVKFGIRRGAAAANTAIIGTPTKTVYGEDSGTSTWDVTVTADTTNGRPNISVTGEAAKTIRWVANIRQTTVTG